MVSLKFLLKSFAKLMIAVRKIFAEGKTWPTLKVDKKQ